MSTTDELVRPERTGQQSTPRKKRRPSRASRESWPAQPSFDTVCDALAFQYAALDELISAIRTSTWHAPTRLTGWRVADLVGRLIADAEQVVEMTRAPRPPEAEADALAWYQGSRRLATVLDAAARSIAAGARRAGLAGRHRTATATAAAILRSGSGDQVLGDPPVGITVADYAVTRTVDAVVCGLDLAAALGHPGHADPSALSLVSGFFAALAQRTAPARAARIAVDAGGTLLVLRPASDHLHISPTAWIEAAVGRCPVEPPLPESHTWLSSALPLVA